MTHERPRWRRRLIAEDGVTLIQTALMLFVLMGFSAFVLDYGVFWLARGQTQNTADAAAMAGVLARADETTKPVEGDNTAAEQSAKLLVTDAQYANKVIGSAAVANVRYELQSLTGPPSCKPESDPQDTVRCVQVDVLRNGANSNPLTTYFGRLFGLNTMDMQATATAQLLPANWARCVRPWMVMDKWVDLNGNGTFDPGTGEYAPPTVGGYDVRFDAGTTLTLAAGDPSAAISPSSYYRVDLTGGGQSAYEDNITECANVTPTTEFQTLPGGGSGPGTQKAVTDLGIGTIVPLALFSPEEWYTLDRTSGKFYLHIVNFFGFKITAVDKTGQVTGVLVQTVGELSSESPVTSGAANGFVVAPALVR